jgi:MFS family permease
MGWRTAATTAGGVLLPLLAGALGHISWHAAFAIYLGAVPLGIATLLAVPKIMTRTAGHADSGDGVARLLRGHPNLLGLYGIVFASGLMLYVPAVFLPKRLEEIGITATLLVAVYGVTLAAVVGSLIGLAYARIRARLTHAAIMRLAAASWLVSLLIYASANQPVLLLLAPIFIGTGNALAMPTLTLLITDNTPTELRGQAMSIQGSAMFGVQFVSPLLAGPLVTTTSYALGFLAAASLAALVLVAATTTSVAAGRPTPPT